MSRHHWSSTVSRPSIHETIRTCTRCGMLRVTRHEGARHWIEWRDDDGKRIGSIDAGYAALAPKCEGEKRESDYKHGPRGAA